jgi:TPP-dependent pyruvate/acetoin dehydrogenase alpha subunit
VFEKRLEERKILTRDAMDELRARCTQELLEASKRVRAEPQPSGSSIYDHVFSERDLVHGLPFGAPPPNRGPLAGNGRSD